MPCVLHDRGAPRSVPLPAGAGRHERADSFAAKCRVGAHAGCILYTDCRAALRAREVSARQETACVWHDIYISYFDLLYYVAGISLFSLVVFFLVFWFLYR